MISGDLETPVDTKKETETDERYSREFVAEDVWGNVPAITVDKNDVPYVAFYNREFGDLIYATKIDSQWKYEIVDDKGDVGTEKGIAVSSGGAVHIAYKDTTNGNTKYAVKRDGNWKISYLEEVPDTHHTVLVDLELDSHEIPHVVYHTELNQGMDQDKYEMIIIKYAVLNNNEWEIEEIAPNRQFT